MNFEWDEAKNAANKLKHGIGFERAVEIFQGRVRTLVDSRFEYGETRQISVGTLEDSIILTVVHTDRNGRCRIISARRASARERSFYEGPLP
jgi:uncharacterized protein